MVTPHLIEELVVVGLWGEKNLTIAFNPHVNIIIGPNASGKTTILNIIRYLLTADLVALRDLQFVSLTLRLREFSGKGRQTVAATKNAERLELKIGTNKYDILFNRNVSSHRLRIEHELRGNEQRELAAIARDLVPAVWLPVSRRLPIPGDDEDEFYYSAAEGRRSQLESVDHRLKQLANELTKYRLQLDATLALKYKHFEKKVLEVMLYDKSRDQIKKLVELNSGDLPRAEEKELLVRSFREAGLIDDRMLSHIQEHFSVAESVISRLGETKNRLQIDDIAILPLIRRTRAMIDAARELERARVTLFTPLRRFETIVSEFFHTKTVRVKDGGDLEIIGLRESKRALTTEKLSSGEKQLLILLGQALLRAGEPDVYIADEPELSLHISWQAELLSSLVELGGQIQIIVATHSPDIVGPFRAQVIDLAKIHD